MAAGETIKVSLPWTDTNAGADADTLQLTLQLITYNLQPTTWNWQPLVGLHPVYRLNLLFFWDSWVESYDVTCLVWFHIISYLTISSSQIISMNLWSMVHDCLLVVLCGYHFLVSHAECCYHILYSHFGNPTWRCLAGCYAKMVN
jgi:hypothetical protein